jgi:hypothetical protein
MKLWRRFRGLTGAICMVTSLAGCVSNFGYTPNADMTLAAAQNTDYLEFCAGSGIRMKPNFAADVSGGVGGHAAFFLNGACRDPSVNYPTLRMCDQLPSDAVQGAGVSMDGNFSNANWTVTAGRSFFYDGGVSPTEPFTQARYLQMERDAEKLGILNGIVFRPELYADKPAGMSDVDYRYDISVGTDYGIGLARGRYCARVPVSRPQMLSMVNFLNAKNEEYAGARHFDGSIMQNNCVHLSHNALAACDVLNPWPTDQFFPFAVLSFPVPKNDFVNIMRRTNDTKMDDLVALFRDTQARGLLLDYDRLPSEPGALATAYVVHAPNDVFETKVALIFYDDPPIGSYLRHFNAIFSQPRYTDRIANLTYFASLYAELNAARKPLATWETQVPVMEQAEFARFYARYYARLTALRGEISAALGGSSVPVG